MALVAKKKPKTDPTYMRLPSDLKKVIEGLSEKHRRPFSSEVAIALEEYAERHGAWPPAGSKPKPPA